MQTLLWTFPLLMVAAIVIGWAAEVTAVHLSAGIALAILAWLQTSPEFAVEAVIAWSRDSHLVLANLTGSLRLLMGLGWPMVFFIHWASAGRKQGARAVTLPRNFSVEAAGLLISVLYFFVIWLKGTWTTVDGVLLCLLYGFYFWMLNRERKNGQSGPEEVEEEAGKVVHAILKLSIGKQKAAAWGLFLLGGLLLLVVAHPFIEGLKAAAMYFGVSQFVFIQWIAPIASEFPEKVTAFGWALKPKRVPMAVVNMLSSIISQWTLMAGMVPIIFSISAGEVSTITFTDFQKTEVLLTVAQSALAVVFLADLKITNLEAIGIFILWLVQFVAPSTRETLIYVYATWMAVEGGRLALDPKQCVAWTTVRQLFRKSPSRGT